MTAIDSNEEEEEYEKEKEEDEDEEEEEEEDDEKEKEEDEDDEEEEEEEDEKEKEEDEKEKEEKEDEKEKEEDEKEKEEKEDEKEKEEDEKEKEEDEKEKEEDEKEKEEEDEKEKEEDEKEKEEEEDNVGDIFRRLVSLSSTSWVETWREDAGVCERPPSRLLYTWRDTSSSISCLVYIFRGDEVTGEMLDDFYTVSEFATATGKVNSCLVVAEDAPSIGRKGQFSIENINGMPCVFAGGCRRRSALMEAATKTIKFLVSNGATSLQKQKNEAEEEKKSAMRRINRLHKDIDANMHRQEELLSESIERMREGCILMTRLSETIRMLGRATSSSTEDHRDADEDDAGEEEEEEDDDGAAWRGDAEIGEIVGNIIQHYRTHDNCWPTREGANLCQSQVRRLGGFKKLLGMAKQTVKGGYCY
jgi:hypothetical protein